MEFLTQIEKSNNILNILRIFAISICTCYIELKIMNKEKMFREKSVFIFIAIVFFSIFYAIIKNILNSFFLNTIILCMLLSVLTSRITKNNIGYSMIITITSLSINYILFCISIALSFIPNVIFNIDNNIIGLIILLGIYLIFVYRFLKIKKIKNGFDFLQEDSKNESFDLLILNISILILLLVIMFKNYDKIKTDKIGYSIVIFSVLMFIIIQKCFQLYYKQKLLEQELSNTKDKLAKTEKELEEAEKENIEISKKNHTITHKQKSLNHKIEEIMAKMEISTEIAIDVEELKSRVDKLSKEINEAKVETELTKTGVVEIDDMLKYMQSECSKRKIEFQLQIKGNIHYMVNNLINKEDLETLIADHVKNAIIAIEHTENENKSILVKLGKIEETYSLYIYDSGIEFEKETLENLGKKPSTTHAEEGGTGMGFMNTLDTLRKCKASLTINEIGKPTKDDYTKVLIIKFDNKNEFKIISYKENVKI